MIQYLKFIRQTGWLAGLTALSTFALGATPADPTSEVAPAAANVRTLALRAGEQIPIHLNKGETIVIEMVSNPSTGYRWDATQYTRERRCYLVKEIEIESPRTPTEGKPLAGAPVKQHWTLRYDPDFPCQSGQRVTWTYRRSWEPFNHTDLQASVLLQGLLPAK